MLVYQKGTLVSDYIFFLALVFMLTSLIFYIFLVIFIAE